MSKKLQLILGIGVVLFLFGIMMFVPYKGWHILPEISESTMSSLFSPSSDNQITSTLNNTTNAVHNISSDSAFVEKSAVNRGLPKEFISLNNEALAMLADLKNKRNEIDKNTKLLSHSELEKLVQEVNAIKRK